MYVRRVRDKVLDFGHRGWLLDESFIFYDHQTDSLWTQATGTCIHGFYKGEKLSRVPVSHTTWGEWKALHPDTLVLAKPLPLIEKYRTDSYEDYYSRMGVHFGLAVYVSGGQKLYPLKAISSTPLLRDEIAGHPVLVVMHQPSGTGLAFDPVVAGKELHFEVAQSTPQQLWLREKESGTIYSGLTGLPRNAAGKPPLPQLISTNFTMENWKGHFPGSPVYPP